VGSCCHCLSVQGSPRLPHIRLHHLQIYTCIHTSTMCIFSPVAVMALCVFTHLFPLPLLYTSATLETTVWPLCRLIYFATTPGWRTCEHVRSIVYRPDKVLICHYCFWSIKPIFTPLSCTHLFLCSPTGNIPCFLWPQFLASESNQGVSTRPL